MVAGAVAGAGGRADLRFVDALNAEWAVLTDVTGMRVEGWAGRHQVLAGCRSLPDVLDAIRRAPDAALHALLTEVAGGDQLAGRVALQTMLGKLVRMARTDRAATLGDYVAALWCQICTYPLAARPVRIAANLALDTLKAVQREQRWPGRERVTTWPPGEAWTAVCDGASAARRQGVGPAAPQVLQVARSERLIDRQTCDLLTTVYVDGLSGEHAAARHATTPGSLRVRCSRGVRQLARHAVALAEAA